MTALKDLRSKYPQYDDMSDETFVSSFHKRFYSDMSRTEFDRRIGYNKERSPSLAKQASDVGEFSIRGFNKGLAEFIGLPYRALDYAAETVTGTGGLPDYDTLDLYKPFLNQPRAETTAGRVAQRAGEAVGASAIPQAALVRAAPLLSQLAPTTTARAIGQTVGQQVARAPAAATGIDAASAYASGASSRGAQEAGYGPAGQMIAGTVGGLVPGIAMAYRYRGDMPEVGSDTMRTISRRRADEALRDSQAFERLGVNEFGPSYNQGPMASVAKQVSETPLIGSPIRNSLDESVEGAAHAARTLADNLSPTATAESAGNRLFQGLNRFRSNRLEDIEPARVASMGINPNRPVGRHLQMGQQQQRDIAQAAQRAPLINADEAFTTRGVRVDPALQRDRVFTNRTNIEDLSDAQLTRVIRAPADETSFVVRQEALFERAFRMLPEMFRSNGSANPNMVPATNTRAALLQVDSNIASSITRQNTITGSLAERLRNSRASNFNISDLRAIRTEIGRDLAGFSTVAPQTLDRSQLKSLYAAVSRDIENGIMQLAARAINRSPLPGTNATTRNAVPVEVAQRAAGALRAFRTADRYTRQGMQRVESFYSLLNANSAEQATSKLVKAALSGRKGDAKLFRNAMSVLQPEERTEFASLVIREMGEPSSGARGSVEEMDWSPTRFLTSWKVMSNEAKDALFVEPGHREALGDLARVARRLSNVEALGNSSRSGTNAINFSGAVGSLAAFASGDVFTPALIGGSGYLTAWLMARPTYARLMVRYLQIKADFLEGTDTSLGPLLNYVNGLRRRSEINPTLVPVLYAVSEDINRLEGDR